jgi:NitT/TauT family transport system substrate-binding protein
VSALAGRRIDERDTYYHQKGDIMLRIGLPYPTMTFLSYYAAVDKGFFAEEKLDVEYVHISGGKDKIMEQFLKGDVHFLYALWEMVELALEEKAELKGLLGSVAEPYYLFVRPEIKQVADLKGKTIIAGVRGSGSEVQAKYVLKQAGLTPGVDVNVSGGDYNARVAALQDPEIDACQDRHQTWYFAQKEGWSYLRFPDNHTVVDSGGISVTRKMIQEEPETVQKAVRAILRATQFIKENRTEAIVLAQKLITYLSLEEITGQYDIMRDHFCPDIAPSTIDFMLDSTSDFLNVPQKLKCEDLVDLSFLQKAKAEISYRY